MNSLLLPQPHTLPAGMTLLPASAVDPAIWDAVQAVRAQAPPRRMVTPHGTMSVEMTSCGSCAWTADASGYRYLDHDPLTGAPWPRMPPILATLATACAAEAGFAGFVPDTCLINDYAPGSKMGIHRDADEADPRWPIVSVSLGIPATFVVATARGAPDLRIPLQHGDVLVFGGPARHCRHGVARVPAARHGLLGARRVNLTFRRAR